MKNLMGALLKAQAQFGTVHKDKTNPAYHSTYATLGSVQDAANPALIANGIVCYQDARTVLSEDGSITVFVGTMLFHVESGEQINQEIGMPVMDAKPQAIGSAITYGRRYGLMTALGLSPDDDDGNGASSTRTQPRQESRQRADVKPQETKPQAAKPAHDERLFKRMHATGKEIMGEAWRNGEGRELLKHVTGKESTKDLSNEEMQAVIAQLETMRSADEPEPVTA